MQDCKLDFKVLTCVAEAVDGACREFGVDVTMAVADSHGNLRYLQRFGNAILASIEISQNKAYTAAAVRMPTAEFGKIAQPGAQAYGINMTHSRLVIFGGGFPLEHNGKIVGGLGISGGSVNEDEEIAKIALKAFAGCMAQG